MHEPSRQRMRLNTGAAQTSRRAAPQRDTPELAALRRDLVLGYHVLDLDGQASGIAGHLSARLPGAGTFWSHRYGVTFGEVGGHDLVEADFELNALRGSGAVNPTMHLHTRIYLARPDLNAIVHTHGRNVLALTTVADGLEMCTQQAALFLDDVALLDEYEGIALGKDEARIVREALGGRHALLLRGHGQLVAGRSIGEAVFRALRLEFVAGAQLAAMAAGAPRALPRAALEQAQRFQLESDNIPLQWEALKRAALRARPALRRMT